MIKDKELKICDFCLKSEIEDLENVETGNLRRITPVNNNEESLMICDNCRNHENNNYNH